MRCAESCRIRVRSQRPPGARCPRAARPGLAELRGGDDALSPLRWIGTGRSSRVPAVSLSPFHQGPNGLQPCRVLTKAEPCPSAAPSCRCRGDWGCGAMAEPPPGAAYGNPKGDPVLTMGVPRLGCRGGAAGLCCCSPGAKRGGDPQCRHRDRSDPAPSCGHRTPPWVNSLMRPVLWQVMVIALIERLGL